MLMYMCVFAFVRVCAFVCVCERFLYVSVCVFLVYMHVRVCDSCVCV